MAGIREIRGATRNPIVNCPPFLIHEGMAMRKAGGWRWAVALLAFATGAAFAQTVKVGSKNFTEQFILAEIYAQALEAAGIKVERKVNLGGTLIAHKALEEKEIDFYPEYTGTILVAVLKQESMTDRKAVYDKVKSEYAAKGLVILNETPFQNTYNMVVRPDTAEKYKLETLTDLAKVSKDL